MLWSDPRIYFIPSVPPAFSFLSPKKTPNGRCYQSLTGKLGTSGMEGFPIDPRVSVFTLLHFHFTIKVNNIAIVFNDANIDNKFKLPIANLFNPFFVQSISSGIMSL